MRPKWTFRPCAKAIAAPSRMFRRSRPCRCRLQLVRRRHHHQVGPGGSFGNGHDLKPSASLLCRGGTRLKRNGDVLRAGILEVQRMARPAAVADDATFFDLMRLRSASHRNRRRIDFPFPLLVRFALAAADTPPYLFAPLKREKGVTAPSALRLKSFFRLPGSSPESMRANASRRRPGRKSAIGFVSGCRKPGDRPCGRFEQRSRLRPICRRPRSCSMWPSFEAFPARLPIASRC